MIYPKKPGSFSDFGLKFWAQVVGACRGHHPQPIGQNRVFEMKRLPPLKL